MNKIEYKEGEGAFINGTLIAGSMNGHWKDAAFALGAGFEMIVTNELSLNQSLDNITKGACFRIDTEVASSLMQHAEFTSRVFAYRQLGILRQLSGKAFVQGTPPSTFKPRSLVLVSYFSDREEMLGFNVVWGI
jgi:hypothetical protein